MKSLQENGLPGGRITMHAIEFLKNSAAIPRKRVYAVHGEDGFLRREVLNALRASIFPGEADDLAVSRFAGAEASLADVLDEIRTLPFFSKERLAVVDDADPFVTAHRKELEAYTEHPSSTGVLVLVLKTFPSSTRLAKLVDKTGLGIDCKGPTEKQLIPWLIHLAKARFGATLEPGASELLLELVGPEVGLLVSEVEKLGVFCGSRGKIQREDVARMVGAGRIETIWKVLDAATTGRGELALGQLDGLLAAGEHPVGLLSAMSVSLLKIHQAGALRRRKVDLRDACQAAGIPPFAVESTGRQHAHLGPSRVDRLPALLLQADLDMKGASMLSPRTVIERLVITLSAPRKD
ncbi:MAG: DNA polymerase III subunit delta [Isosphaeraceae bacterium]